MGEVLCLYSSMEMEDLILGQFALQAVAAMLSPVSSGETWFMEFSSFCGWH